MMNKNIKNAIDTRLDDIKISDELKSKILNNSCKKRRKLKKPFYLTAATILCVMVSVTVMATNIPSFKNLVSIVSSEVVRFLQPIHLTSEDKGIKMEVVATMNDQDTAVAYITMQDLTGDRVDKSIDLYNYSITGMSSYTSQVVAYDKAKKIATIRLLANGGKELNGKKVTVKVDSFLSDKKTYKLFDTGIDLKNIISNSTTKTIPLNMNGNTSGGSGDLFEEFREKGTINILKTDEMNIALHNINFAYISNIGIADGQLHIQTKWTGEGVDDHGCLILTDNLGKKVYPTNIYFGVDENGNTKYGRNYVEYIFDIKETELNKYKLEADNFTTHGHYTEGKWQTTFKIKAVKKGTEANCDIKLGEIKINKVFVSPMGVSLIGRGSEKSNANKISLSIKMLDGSTLSEKSASVMLGNNGGEISYKYMPSTPINVASVKEIIISGNVVKIH